VNQPVLNVLHPDEVDVVIQRVDEAEVDKMWSYVEKKTAPRWLWYAIDHQTGKVLAYVFGRRQTKCFCSSKSCTSRLASGVITPIMGARTPGISIPPTIIRASGICSRSSANI
jgi:IS1 transposase